MDVQTASNVRARVLRSKVLSLAKTCSIGLKSAAPGGCQDSCRIKLDAQASQSDVDADHGLPTTSCAHQEKSVCRWREGREMQMNESHNAENGFKNSRKVQDAKG